MCKMLTPPCSNAESVSTAHPLEFPSVVVQGVPIAAVGLREAVDAICRAAESGEGGYFSFTGAHGVVSAQNDAELRGILGAATANFTDGVPVLWGVRRRCAATRAGRVFGPDFMEAMLAVPCPDSTATRLRHFLCGGREGVAERISENFADAEIVGTHTPPFRALSGEEFADLVAEIERSQAQLIWIGLSTPRQERLAAQLSAALPGRLIFAVGAAFDIHAGLTQSAPPAIQDIGMEWAWRLMREPGRLFTRYASIVPRFICGELRDFVRSFFQGAP